MPGTETTHSPDRLSGCFFVDQENLGDTENAVTHRLKMSSSETSLSANPCGALSITGNTYQASDTLTVAITGKPTWSCTELQLEAAKNGHAASLAMAYSRFDQDFVKTMGGAFSFAILDAKSGTCHLGIDRLGQHTLYYLNTDKQLIFGTSLADVVGLAGEGRSATNQGLYNYVYFHMVPSPNAIYQGINKLYGASRLTADKDKTKVKRYWSPQFRSRASTNFQTSSGELKTLLRDSVSRSIEDQKNVGTFLSGGLDSSTVTGVLSELGNDSRPAYAIGFDELGYDEMEFARATAKHFDVPLQEYYVTPEDIFEELPTIAKSYDEPFGNSSALPAYFCARRAQEDGIDCLLAGDGGDEIFAGNERYGKQGVFSLYGKIPAGLRASLIEPLVSNLPESLRLVGKAQSYISQAKVPLPDRLQSYNYLHRFSPEKVFDEKFLQAVDTEQPLNLQRDTYHSLSDASELSRMLYLDWQYTLADNDLRKVSRMCALANINVQYPLLDDQLVEFSCGIPDRWKIRRGDLRHFFKESMKGWLPDSTIYKKKQGFGLPFGLWMKSYKPLNDMAGECLSRLDKRGFFQNGFINRLLKMHATEHAAYYGELVWVLTILELWLEEHQP